MRFRDSRAPASGVSAVRIGAGALVLLSALVAPAAPAIAEVGAPTPTVQAVAADATWLAYTPPPEHPGIVCMVDSGVDPNPDTEAAVIGGQALAPETNTLDEIANLEPRVQPGNHPDGHGTLMAMMMAAPINGWGMAGIAPTSVRVYNMKALKTGEIRFPFAYYSAAIEDCHRLKAETYPSLNTINLSLGGEASPGQSELVGLENYVSAAHSASIGIVAAAGNEGGTVLYPAAYPPILAVGAGAIGSAPGALCSFASRGESLDAIGPGCDEQAGGLQGAFEDDGSPAFGSGSSQASAIVSAVFASMRAYAPQLTYAKAEECLITTAKSGSIDAAAAFEACGLSQVVSEGQAAEQVATGSQQQTNSESQSSSSQTISLSTCMIVGGCQGTSVSSNEAVRTADFESTSRCPRPQIVGVTSHDGHLILRVRSRPEGCRLQARLRVGRGPRYRWQLTQSMLSTTIRLPRLDFHHIEARFGADTAKRISSRWVSARVLSGGF
jgi:Subtilase family